MYHINTNQSSTKHKVGYTLAGSDFKTLEFPVMNNSYSLEKPGWLNDSIIDSYLLLLMKASPQKGIRVHVLNSFFYLRLRNTMLKRGNEKRLHEIISRTRQMIDYEACDYILIPINIHNHWTAVVINIWNTQMFYYDPMGKGIQNETVIKLFKVFFELFYKCNKTCDIEIESKGFIKDFDVIWEEKFSSQKDSCSCEVFILMYMSYHLGLLTFDTDVQSISKIRNEMAK